MRKREMSGHDFWIVDARFVRASTPRVLLRCSTCGLSCTGVIESGGDRLAAEYVDNEFSTGEPNPFSELRLLGIGDCVGVNFFAGRASR